MRTIAIVNQKGGCGKTTTAINLAALYARRGLRTLLVDMDPQSHCAAGLGVPEHRIEYSIADALLADHNRGFDSSTLLWEVARNLHLAPSTMLLSALEAPGGGLHQLPDKDRRLESLLACMADKFDRCLIDCPPTIGLLTFNALRAAREALIPVETGFFSLRGAEKQWNTIQRMIAHIGRPIACHLLPTLHDPQSQLACNILAALRRQFAGQILPVLIHEDEALREAASLGQPVFEYAPKSQATRDFEALADWLEDHAAAPAVDIEILPHEAVLHRQGTTVSDATISGPGGRAAELARRVRTQVCRAQEVAPSHENTPSEQPSKTTALDPDIPDTQQPSAPEILQPEPDQSAQMMHASTAAAVLFHERRNALTIDREHERAIAPIQAEQADAATRAAKSDSLQHLYGVRQTSQGVLFVQPMHLATQLSVVGDFNHWSPGAHPMQMNVAAGVFELLLRLPPGRHEYLLVADGNWMTDPFNPNQQINTYGEPNSTFVVS